MASKFAEVQQSISPINNVVINFVGRIPTEGNTSVLRKVEEEMHNPALYDTLTGLPNRLLLYDRLSHAMSESKTSKLYGALLVLDLNHFKALSDKQYAYRNVLVVEAANRIKSCVREEYTMASLGYDEFAVLFENISTSEEVISANVSQVADMIRVALDVPFQFNDQIYPSKPHFGASLFCADIIRPIELNCQ